MLYGETVSDAWVVPATVVSVHDGDTATFDLDLGWYITKRDHVRVAHIDAPELTTAAGKIARDFAARLLPVGARVTVTSHKLDKYGRSLASLTLPDGQDFATLMLAGGFAVPYEGGAR